MQYTISTKRRITTMKSFSPMLERKKYSKENPLRDESVLYQNCFDKKKQKTEKNYYLFIVTV